MKAHPGALKQGSDIIGREQEIAELWRKLEGNSVLFTAERRVGKSSVIEKMKEHPANGWVVLLCYVESKRHPSELVGEIFWQARDQSVLSRKANWLARFTKIHEALTGAEAEGWRLPPVEKAWKRLLTSLIEDLSEHDGPQVVIMLDEFPTLRGIHLRPLSEGRPRLRWPSGYRQGGEYDTPRHQRGVVR
jgi:AAA+ ATPase superfamily predicted ATPase